MRPRELGPNPPRAMGAGARTDGAPARDSLAVPQPSRAGSHRGGPCPRRAPRGAPQASAQEGRGHGSVLPRPSRPGTTLLAVPPATRPLPGRHRVPPRAATHLSPRGPARLRARPSGLRTGRSRPAARRPPRRRLPRSGSDVPRALAGLRPPVARAMPMGRGSRHALPPSRTGSPAAFESSSGTITDSFSADSSHSP